MKCAKKTCERGFSHVMAFAFSFEMPQNRKLEFSDKNILTRLRIELWFFEEQHGICLCSSFGTEMRWSNTVQECRIFSIASNLSFRFSAMIRLLKFTRIVNISFKGKKAIFTGIFFLIAFKIFFILGWAGLRLKFMKHVSSRG